MFNIKAFGLLTQHPIDPRRLPDVVRERLPKDVLEKGRVYHDGVPADVRELVWTMHIEALQPLAEAGKLGCLLFQFPPWFRKNRASVDYLHELRERLPWPIAVEFRGGGWMEAERPGRTLKLLEDIGLAYVSVDEPQGFPSSTPPVVACTAELAKARQQRGSDDALPRLRRPQRPPAGRAAGATASGICAGNAVRRQSIITRRSHTAPAESTYPRISLPPYGLDLLL